MASAIRYRVLPLDDIPHEEYNLRVDGKVKKPLRRPWASRLLEEEVFLEVLKTGEALVFPVAELFRQRELSLSQYNVLRILRGASGGLSCGEILERMVTHDSDITRLLDALEKRSLVTRSRSAQDRRVVLTVINRKGLVLLDALDEPLTALHRSHLGHMSRSDLKKLAGLLEQARGAREAH